jgi:hypothetical protein
MIAAGIAYGIEGAPQSVSTVYGPTTVLRRDRTVFGAVTLAVTLATASAVSLVAGVGERFDIQTGLAAGLTYGVTIGITAASGQGAWGRYTATRSWLTMNRGVPWRLMSFLADAHIHHGVLRQVGPVYRFRHLNLQRRLAGQYHAGGGQAGSLP